MSALAIYASTVAAAVQLAQTHHSAEATRRAASVAAVALDFASTHGQRQLEAELRAANLLGEGPEQFPGDPWILWKDDRIFRLLKSAELDAAAEALRGVTVQKLMEMSPASILALLGAPHRPLWVPRWGLALATGLAVGSALVVLYREHNVQGGRRPWPA